MQAPHLPSSLLPFFHWHFRPRRLTLEQEIVGRTFHALRHEASIHIIRSIRAQDIRQNFCGLVPQAGNITHQALREVQEIVDQ